MSASSSTTALFAVRWVDYTDPLVVPMLTELDREYGNRYGHPLGDLDAERLRNRARFAPPDGGLLLLLEAGVPVAGAAFCRFDERTAEFKRIWTGTAHRRRGLARRVLTELEAECARRGYRRVYLTTGPRRPRRSASTSRPATPRSTTPTSTPR